MKIVDLEEAKANLEGLARECRSSPVVVTVDGSRPSRCAVLLGRSGFIDRLLEQNEPFRRLLESRHKECEAGNVSSLEDVRRRIEEK